MRPPRTDHNAVVRIQLEIEVASENPLYTKERMSGDDQESYVLAALHEYYKQVLVDKNTGAERLSGAVPGYYARTYSARTIRSAKRTRVLTEPGDLIHRPRPETPASATATAVAEVRSSSHSEPDSEEPESGSVGVSDSRDWSFSLR